MGKTFLQKNVCGMQLCSGPLKVFNGVSLPVLHIEKGNLSVLLFKIDYTQTGWTEFLDSKS